MPDASPDRSAPGSVWNRPERGARGPRPEHSRAEITSAAIALADAGGLSAVSMRAVAGALGTTAGSLYRYLSSRDDLLDLMVDLALGELELDRPASGDWLDDLVLIADDQLALYRRHGWLLEAALRGGSLGPNATDYFECCLRILAPLTRGTATKMEAIALITGVVSLFARATPAQSRQVSPEEVFRNVSAQTHPHLVAALADPAPSAPQTDLFARTVRSVMSGLLGR